MVSATSCSHDAHVEFWSGGQEIIETSAVSLRRIHRLDFRIGKTSLVAASMDISPYGLVFKSDAIFATARK